MFDSFSNTFQVVDSATVRTNEPYRHPAIIAVMRKYFFTGNKSLGRRFHDTFSSSIDSDNSKEIPQAMLGIVVVAVQCSYSLNVHVLTAHSRKCLDLCSAQGMEWRTGSTEKSRFCVSRLQWWVRAPNEASPNKDLQGRWNGQGQIPCSHVEVLSRSQRVSFMTASSD